MCVSVCLEPLPLCSLPWSDAVQNEGEPAGSLLTCPLTLPCFAGREPGSRTRGAPCLTPCTRGTTAWSTTAGWTCTCWQLRPRRGQQPAGRGTSSTCRCTCRATRTRWAKGVGREADLAGCSLAPGEDFYMSASFRACFPRCFLWIHYQAYRWTPVHLLLIWAWGDLIKLY